MRGSVAEHVRDAVVGHVGPVLPDRLQDEVDGLVFFPAAFLGVLLPRGLVRDLGHQERHYRVDALLVAVGVPELAHLDKVKRGVADHRGREVAVLVGNVQRERVLQQPGVLNILRVDDDVLLLREGLGLRHRLVEALHGRRDAPHDRHGRVRTVAVDDLLDDGLLGVRLATSCLHVPRRGPCRASCPRP